MNRFNSAAAAALPAPAPTVAAADLSDFEAWLDMVDPTPEEQDEMARNYEREAQMQWADDQSEPNEGDLG